MTLAELIHARGHKFDKEIGVPCSDHWNGYKTGWYWAYQDLKEILEHNGFNMNVEVMSPRTNTSQEAEIAYLQGSYVLEPSWVVRPDNALQLREISLVRRTD